MSIGVVVIGRNEGERLRRCLKSVSGSADKVVYVDSGSTDGSVTMAREMGVVIVDLDMQIPFTAARARNEGARLLLQLIPQLEYIQFVDGDCELIASWLEKAEVFLEANKNVAMICGRLRERYPERSIYNQLCDMEWDTPIGQAKACGGIAMVRKNAFAAAGGYRADMIAGEEPELCVRLRAAGWQIWRIDAEMALHDAAMTRFGQWWKRTLRAGYAYAQGAHLHGISAERHGILESQRALIWGAVLPLMILVLAIVIGPWYLLLALIYPVQVARLALRGKRSRVLNWWRAVFLVMGKFPEALGQIKFLYNRLAGKKARLIEYK